jgi:hypothetical protein
MVNITEMRAARAIKSPTPGLSMLPQRRILTRH